MNVDVRVSVAEHLEVQMNRSKHTIDRPSDEPHLGPERSMFFGAEVVKVGCMSSPKHHNGLPGRWPDALEIPV